MVWRGSDNLPFDIVEALDLLPEALAFLDRQGCLRYWNAAFEAQSNQGGLQLRLGMTRDDMADQIVTNGVVPSGNRTDVIKLLSITDKCYEASLPSGSWRRVRRYQTQDGGTFSTSIDVTTERNYAAALAQSAKNAEAANLAKSAFLATMSHEIRTPLNGVLGMAQAMEDDPLSPIQQERLGVIRQSGEALLAILNDVLDLSKIESGKLELESVPFNLEELAQGAAAAFTALANKKGLSFRFKLEPQAAGRYVGDPTRIRQIIYNLVSNALKFTHEGYIVIRIEREGGQLLCEVEDTGIGIAEEQLQVLFTRFNQADASTTRRYGGTGLGLAICRELAELMGGDITCVSKLGSGTTFRVRIPLEWLAPSVAENTAEIESDLRETSRINRSMRILVAEDNHTNQIVIKTLLLQSGIVPKIVSNGTEALNAFGSGEWDVVLMDIQMPEMDGPSTTRAIRALEAAQQLERTPIVALTANVLADQTERYLASGMDACVGKPIRVGELLEAIDRVTTNRDARCRHAA